MLVRNPLFKFFIDRVYGPFVVRYLAKERRYRFRGLTVTIPPGIFHPGFFFSTKLLIRYLDGIDVAGKSVLEIGAGSGLVSMILAGRGAAVTASDINPEAVLCVRRNAERAGIRLEAVESDLFERLGGRFDLVVINPPYFAADPADMKQRAWFCGAEFSYFEGLFAGLAAHMVEGGRCVMVLSELCDVDRIIAIAARHGMDMERAVDTMVLWERNFVYELRPRIRSGA